MRQSLWRSIPAISLWRSYWLDFIITVFISGKLLIAAIPEYYSCLNVDITFTVLDMIPMPLNTIRLSSWAVVTFMRLGLGITL
jgi:hypothetical protein